MISYRELAMRVLGKPLHISERSARPTAHRVTALALTAAMVAGLSAPAFAGTYYLDNGKGDITVTKTDSGTYVKRSGKQYDNDLGELDKDGDVIIKNGMDDDSNTDRQPGAQQSGTDNAAATQEAKEDAQPVVTDEEKSVPGPEASEQTPETEDDTEETETPETLEETEDEAGSDGEADSKEETEAEPEPEGDVEDETQPEGNAPAGNAEGQPALDTMELNGTSAPVAEGSEDKEDTYDKAPTTFAEQVSDGLKAAVKSTTSAIIKIINKVKNVTDEDGNVTTDNTLNVTLDGVTVNATGRKDSALTVSGKGDTTLTLKNNNKLTGDSGKSGLLHTKQNSKDDTESLGTLTITGTKNDSLTAQGGASAEGNGSDGIRSEGNLTLSGGTIKATGGNGSTSNYKSSGNGGSGIYSSGKLTISGGNIEATGGNGNTSGQSSSGNGGDGIYSSELTISDGEIRATGGNGNTTNNYYTSGCGGNGIKANSKLTMSDGTIDLAQGGNGQYQSIYDYNDHSNCAGRDGISGGRLEITGGIINNALGGNGQKGGCGGNGISGSLIHIGGTAKINNTLGGDTDSSTGIGSCGIASGANGYVTIDGSADVTAKGGSNSDASAGIYGDKGIKIKDNATVKATAGTSNSRSTSGFMVYVSYGPQKKKAEDVLDKDSNATATAYKNDDTIDSETNHNYGEWAIITPATCLKTGKQTRTCSTCNQKETQTIPKTNHTWSDWEPVSGDSTKEFHVCQTEGCNAREERTVTTPGGTTDPSKPGSGSSENPGGGSTGGGSGSGSGSGTDNPGENPGGGTDNPNPNPGENPGTDNPGENPNPGTPSVTPGAADSGSSSGSSDSAVAPVVQEPVVITPAGVPGYTFTGTMGGSIRVNTDVTGSAIKFRTLHYKAALHTTLGQLRAQGITRITFRTLLGSSTLSVEELLALGSDETEVVLTHSGSSATLTVGGVQHNELIH